MWNKDARNVSSLSKLVERRVFNVRFAEVVNFHA